VDGTGVQKLVDQVVVRGAALTALPGVEGADGFLFAGARRHDGIAQIGGHRAPLLPRLHRPRGFFVRGLARLHVDAPADLLLAAPLAGGEQAREIVVRQARQVVQGFGRAALLPRQLLVGGPDQLVEGLRRRALRPRDVFEGITHPRRISRRPPALPRGQRPRAVVLHERLRFFGLLGRGRVGLARGVVAQLWMVPKTVNIGR
jgi:hypothetical protein